jgi:TonB family protein
MDSKVEISHLCTVKKEKPYHSIKKPHFLGDKNAFQQFLDKNLVYPKEALEHKIEGVVHLKCEINDKGKVLKAEPLHKMGYGLDEEAVRLCLLMKFENISQHGVRIKHTTTLKVPFVLPKAPPVEQTVNINYQVTPPESKPKNGSGGAYNYSIKL